MTEKVLLTMYIIIVYFALYLCHNYYRLGFLFSQLSMHTLMSNSAYNNYDKIEFYHEITSL